MVLDPYLKQHLAHFGIKIQDMEKTDKSMVELEIDMNQKYGECSLGTLKDLWGTSEGPIGAKGTFE